MKALVYLGPTKKAPEERPKPDACETFAHAASTRALKVMIDA
jgi:hypothetical protein